MLVMEDRQWFKDWAEEEVQKTEESVKKFLNSFFSKKENHEAFAKKWRSLHGKEIKNILL